MALKVIKPGMDTRAVIARFEAERQALAEALTSTLALDEGNQVAVDAPNAQKLALKLTVPSGTFSGSLVHPQTDKPAAIKGVLLQKQNLGGGFLLGTNQSGSVKLTPWP